MLYIVVALKAEAQAFVDKYKLHKSTLAHFRLYSNETMQLIISGIGVKNARDATETLIKHFDATDADIYLNIGICGASSHYKIGALLEIGTITYEGVSYTFKEEASSLVCVNGAISSTQFSIVDMESYGFYDALIHNPAIQNFFILKVVSDHFEPESVTKERAKMLLFQNLKTIMELKF